MKLLLGILSGFWYLIMLASGHHASDLYPALEMVFYSGSKKYPEYYSIPDFDSITLNPNFNINKTTMIYIHGYTEGLSTLSLRTVISAYQKRNDTNVLALNWQNYSSGIYIEAISHAVGIGHLIGICINYWIEHETFVEEKLHIVGHSMGAQLAGFIGKGLKFFSRGLRKIKRITGLDPAKPLFYTNLTSEFTYISKEDAELVDIIHTNAGILGASISVGNCDFFPNGGTFQPGCSGNALCDHARSWYYYAESVEEHEPSFDAIRCDSFDHFKALECSNSSSITFMGFHSPMDCSGEYFLQTNSQPPFSRGVFGLQFFGLIDTDRQTANKEN